MSDTMTDIQRDQYLLLMNAPGNAVVYSEKAWCVARKSAGSVGAYGRWHPDQGAHRTASLSMAEMVEWVDDWVLMVPASPDTRLGEEG